MSLLRSSFNLLTITKTLYKLETTTQTRQIKRWVAPTLRELRKRVKLLGPQPEQRRSEFAEWNYHAELYAFGKRLNEKIEIPLLQIAFTQKAYVETEQQKQRELGIEEENFELTDNENLSKIGYRIAEEYTQSFLKHSLPQCPQIGIKIFTDELLNKKLLAFIAMNLGMKDLLFDNVYPPTEDSLAKSLLAIIGALNESSNTERAFLFVRDFICTQLNQRDLLDWWNFSNPLQLLQAACKELNILGELEPRLLGDCGKNTVLSAYHIGIYNNKKLLGKGFGEDVETATNTAAIDALQKLFGLQDNMKPFNFKIKVELKQAIN